MAGATSSLLGTHPPSNNNLGISNAKDAADYQSKRTSAATSILSNTLTLTPATTTSVEKAEVGTPELDNLPSASTTSEERTKIPPAVHLSFTALTLSLFLVALDTVLIPTALPTVSRSFHIPDSLYAWIGSAYLLSNAASVPFWGKLSNVFGRKPVVLIASIMFLIGSLLCALAVSAGMLVGGRAVQGFGGGGVVILVHICVADLFAIRDRSFYLGIVGSVWAVASALGPVLGGIFAQRLSWRWCFYINLPIIAVTTALLFFTLHIPSPRIALWTGLRAIDWPGSLTIISATLILLIGLQLGGSTLPWSSATVILLITFGFLTYILFFASQYYQEKRGRSPIMPLRIFGDFSNLSCLGVCACDALVFNSVAYFLPLYFQTVLTFSPSASGVLMLSLAIPLALVSLLAGFAIEKTGRYLLILRAGMALMTAGVGSFIAFPATRNYGMIIGFLIILGVGFGPNFHAPLIALQARIQESDIAAGTATFGFVRMVSGAIGVVIGQVVFQSLMRGKIIEFLEAGVRVGVSSALAMGEVVSDADEVAQLPEAQRNAVRQGMNMSLRGTWIFFTAVSVVGLLVSFGIRRQVLGREQAEATPTKSMQTPDVESGRGDTRLE